jgi:putative heme transporter
MTSATPETAPAQSGQNLSEGASDDRTPKTKSTLRKRMTRTIQVVVMLFLLNTFVLPQLTGARKAIRAASDVRPLLLLTGLALEVVSLLCYAKLTRVALSPTPLRTRTIFRIQLATKALTNVVPGGSAAGPALGYRLLLLAGEERASAGFALALVGLGSAALLNVILWLTFVVSIPFSGVRPGYVTVALVGVFILATFFALIFAAIRGADRAELIVGRLAARFRFIDADRSATFIRRFGGRAEELAGKPRLLGRLAFWATMNWLIDAAALWVFLLAFGVRMRPDSLLVAFCLASITAAIPITPGGLGLFEAALGAGLGLFGVPIAQGALAISAYRLAAYWLPIPVGGLSYLSLRIGPFRIHRVNQRLGRLRDEATPVLERGERLYDWAERVADSRVSAAAAAAAANGEVVILADRAHPGSVRPGTIAPPANAPKANKTEN